MKGSEIFWAIAPEYASASFDRLADPPRGLARVDADAGASLILSQAGRIALLEISGPIERRTDVWGERIWTLGQDAIYAAIEKSVADPGVGAILLSFESPGGVVAGTRELADFIAASPKPIAAYADGLCASAAYWLASATGRIFSPATAQVGSVGVLMTLADMSGFFQKMGVKFEYIGSGKYKTAGRGELTDEDRAYFSEKLAQLHEIFRADVARNLKITAPEPEWAEAQILVASHAQKLGLVSQIVADRAAAIKILEDELMPNPLTLEGLRTEAPELVGQIEAEAAKQALAAVPDNAELAKAAFRAVCPDAVYAAGSSLFDKALALKLSPDQLSGLASALKNSIQAEPATPAKGAVDEALAGHPAPLNSDTPRTGKSALVADAEARSKK